jgi:hypothetical protein
VSEKDHSRPELLSTVLGRSWKNNHEKFEVITRVKLIRADDGHLLPGMTVPSLDPSVDESVISACNQAINEYPMLRWDDEEFEFVCGDKHRAVMCVTQPREFSRKSRWDFSEPEPPKPRTFDPALLDPLRQRLTEACIREYCRDDTLGVPRYFAPDFPPLRNGGWTAPRVSEENRMWCHDLFPSAKNNGYPITVSVSFANGKPVIYRLSTHWMKNECKLELDAEDRWTDCSEYFLRRRIRYQLFVSILRYQLAHCLDEKTNDGQKRKPVDGMWKDTITSYDKDRTIYTCPLQDGRTVGARLDKKREIERVEIDGKVDSLWTSALQELEGDPYGHKTWPFR